MSLDKRLHNFEETFTALWKAHNDVVTAFAQYRQDVTACFESVNRRLDNAGKHYTVLHEKAEETRQTLIAHMNDVDFAHKL